MFTEIVPGRLWQVRDLLAKEQVEDILTTQWLSLATDVSSEQELWLRRQVMWNDPCAQRLGGYINSQLDKINSALTTKFTLLGGHFWIDLPGFTVDMHTDGHLPNSMQLYWLVPGPEYGTGFYQYRDRQSLIYQFDSQPNSGYIMLNHLNDDGSQPLQWHAMFNPVPDNTIRVSSYWQFS